MAVEDARQGQPRRKAKGQPGAAKFAAAPFKGDGLEKARERLGPSLDFVLTLADEADRKAREERQRQSAK